MRPIFWDDGTRFDDPNARWGDPSYVLELGDPGYIAPPEEPGTISPRKHNTHTMSNNATPTTRTILASLARTILAGQISHGATIDLHHHLAPEMDAAIKKLEGDPDAALGSVANKGSQLVYRDAIDTTGDAEAALTTLSDTAVKSWLEGYRKIMEGIHGKKANAGWEAAGFGQGTTAVPRNHDKRHVLLSAARAYLAAHASYEGSLPQSSGPALAITAARALVLHTEMQVAKTLITTCTATQTTAKAVRDADVDALFDEVSDTISELHEVLSDTDPLWEIFGLNIPANPNPPLGVSAFTITSAGAGRELLSWHYAVRAEYYRVFIKRVGIDAEFINVDDPKDLEYTMKNLAPGSTIEAYVVPMNGGGAGPASPTVSKVVGV